MNIIKLHYMINQFIINLKIEYKVSENIIIKKYLQNRSIKFLQDDEREILYGKYNS